MCIGLFTFVEILAGGCNWLGEDWGTVTCLLVKVCVDNGAGSNHL